MTESVPIEEVDLLVAGGDLITMNPRREIIQGGGLAVVNDEIVAVGSVEKLRRRYRPIEVIDASGCVITPGMINAHQHLTGDPLVKSCIPDLLAPGESIFSWSVPLHGSHIPDDDEISAQLTAIEAVTNGVTTLVEAGTVAYPDRVVRGMTEVGVRGTVGAWGWDIEEGPFTAPVDEIVDRQRTVVESYPRGGLVEGWVTLVGHDLVSDELLCEASALALEAEVGLTMHMSPTESDPLSYLRRTGRRPLGHLADLGVLGEHLLIAHGVWLDDEEVELLLDTKTALAYCPWAYLRLGQGVSRVGRHAEIFERGGRVALGCDAANAGDSIDILKTAALAVGIARDSRVDPTRFGAHEGLEMATIAGAEAIGMAARIGSLEVGKKADLVVFETTGISWIPRGDVVLQLVWGSDGRSVRDVVVGGRTILRDRSLTTVDIDQVRHSAQEAQQALLARAGIAIPSRWPHVVSR